jgi:hypothetical protein
MGKDQDLADVIDKDVANEKKSMSGQTPPSTTTNEGVGSVSTSQVGMAAGVAETSFEGEVLAYRELSNIACGIATMIIKAGHTKLILYDQGVVDALPALEAFRAQAQLLRDQYRELPAPTSVRAKAVIAALGTATTLVKGFLDLLSLFRSDVQVSSSGFNPDEVALIAELADRLREGKPSVSLIYPSVGPSAGAEKIWDLLQELAQAKAEARQRASGDAELEARVSMLDAHFDSFLQSLMKPEAGSGSATLSTLARAEVLQKSLQDGRQILFVKIVRAGVSRRLLENFWTRVFYRDRVSFSGGAVVTFMLLDKTGTILLSKTLYSHSGYTKFNEGHPLHERGKNF